MFEFILQFTICVQVVVVVVVEVEVEVEEQAVDLWICSFLYNSGHPLKC